MESRHKLVILGGGESGVGAALLAQAKGYNVFLSDQGPLKDKYREILTSHQIDFEENTHTEEIVFQADLIIKSPGIPDKAPIIKELLKKGTPILSEIEFASRYTNAKLIAITGSNGKTTTTLLTYHLLKNAGLSVGLAGNVGESFAKQVLDDTFDTFVLELSSFQLDNMYDFHANISVILNITPDHLDRYEYKFQNYVDSKFRITQNQTTSDTLFYFRDSEVVLKELSLRKLPLQAIPVSLVQEPSNGAFASDHELTVQFHGKSLKVNRDTLPLKGPHNAVNMLIASSIALEVGVSPEKIIEGLHSFINAPHRLEKVGEIEGVSYINDSKATNVDSVFYALGSYQTPIILIIGGVDKGNDYDQIRDLVLERVKGVIALGKDNEKLTHYFKDLVPNFHSTDSLDEAIITANHWSQPNDIVLLSPACASFDLFNGYEDRGNKFRTRVHELILNK